MLTRCERPETVLMTTDTVGGIWTYALDLARALARSGTRTILATLGPGPSPGQRAAALAVPDLVLEVGDARLEWMDPTHDDIAGAGEWLLALERTYRPDVVHLNGFAQGALPFSAPVVVVAHSCIGSWWRAVHGEPPPARYREYLERLWRGLHGADAVVAPTAAFLADLDRLYGPLPGATTIPNGREPHGFFVGHKREMVFSAGRVWDEAKNVIALDRVAPDLPWPVVVAGDWRPPDGLSEPPNNLLCLDLVEPARLRQWFAEAPIFALPARYEPFGLAALEAALSGCALVLGDLATQREVWGDTALYVPPDDPKALCRTLHQLIADPEWRNSLAKHARLRAQALTADRMARRYLDLYAQLMAWCPTAEGPLAYAAQA